MRNAVKVRRNGASRFTPAWSPRVGWLMFDVFMSYVVPSAIGSVFLPSKMSRKHSHLKQWILYFSCLCPISLFQVEQERFPIKYHEWKRHTSKAHALPTTLAKPKNACWHIEWLYAGMRWRLKDRKGAHRNKHALIWLYILIFWVLYPKWQCLDLRQKSQQRIFNHSCKPKLPT